MATVQFSIFGSDQSKPVSRPTLLNGARRSTRYPIALSVRFHSIDRVRGHGGAGITRDLSSHGMFIETDREKADPGSLVKIIMDWPVLLEGNIRLQFIAEGQVVRCDAFGFGVRILRHEYRTRRKELGTLPITATASPV
jgi:hypothetical protein